MIYKVCENGKELISTEYFDLANAVFITTKNPDHGTLELKKGDEVLASKTPMFTIEKRTAFFDATTLKNSSKLSVECNILSKEPEAVLKFDSLEEANEIFQVWSVPSNYLKEDMNLKGYYISIYHFKKNDTTLEMTCLPNFSIQYCITSRTRKQFLTRTDFVFDNLEEAMLVFNNYNFNDNITYRLESYLYIGTRKLYFTREILATKGE